MAEQSCVPEISQAWDFAVKELEEKQEEEELPAREAAGDRDSHVQSTSVSPLKEKELEAEACGLAGDAQEEGCSKLLLTLEAEEVSRLSVSPLPGGP